MPRIIFRGSSTSSTAASRSTDSRARSFSRSRASSRRRAAATRSHTLRRACRLPGQRPPLLASCRNSLLRRLLSASQAIQRSVHDREGEPQDLAERAERLLFNVAHSGAGGEDFPCSRTSSRATPRLQQARQRHRLVTEHLGVHRPRRDHGRLPDREPDHPRRPPGIGKSGLVANIAEHVAVKERRPVAFFSLEMSDSELAQA